MKKAGCPAFFIIRFRYGYQGTTSFHFDFSLEQDLLPVAQQPVFVPSTVLVLPQSLVWSTGVPGQYIDESGVHEEATHCGALTVMDQEICADGMLNGFLYEVSGKSAPPGESSYTYPLIPSIDAVMVADPDFCAVQAMPEQVMTDASDELNVTAGRSARNPRYSSKPEPS